MEAFRLAGWTDNPQPQQQQHYCCDMAVVVAAGVDVMPVEVLGATTVLLLLLLVLPLLPLLCTAHDISCALLQHQDFQA